MIIKNTVRKVPYFTVETARHKVYFHPPPPRRDMHGRTCFGVRFLGRNTYVKIYVTLMAHGCRRLGPQGLNIQVYG